MKNDSQLVQVILSANAVDLLTRWRALSTARQQRCINGVGDMAIVKPHGWGIETCRKEPSPLLAEALLAALLDGS